MVTVLSPSRCTTRVRCPRSRPGCSMSAPSASEIRRPLSATSEHRACSLGDERPAATRKRRARCGRDQLLRLVRRRARWRPGVGTVWCTSMRRRSTGISADGNAGQSRCTSTGSPASGVPRRRRAPERKAIECRRPEALAHRTSLRAGTTFRDTSRRSRAVRHLEDGCPMSMSGRARGHPSLRRRRENRRRGAPSSGHERTSLRSGTTATREPERARSSVDEAVEAPEVVVDGEDLDLAEPGFDGVPAEDRGAHDRPCPCRGR